MDEKISMAVRVDITEDNRKFLHEVRKTAFPQTSPLISYLMNSAASCGIGSYEIKIPS